MKILVTGATGFAGGEVLKQAFDDYAACVWCLGVSQTQATEKEYIRITLDYAVAAAKAMFAANPQMRFCFVSGRSADRGEKASALYARNWQLRETGA